MNRKSYMMCDLMTQLMLGSTAAMLDDDIGGPQPQDLDADLSADLDLGLHCDLLSSLSEELSNCGLGVYHCNCSPLLRVCPCVCMRVCVHVYVYVCVHMKVCVALWSRRMECVAACCSAVAVCCTL